MSNKNYGLIQSSYLGVSTVFQFKSAIALNLFSFFFIIDIQNLFATNIFISNQTRWISLSLFLNFNCRMVETEIDKNR